MMVHLLRLEDRSFPTNRQYSREMYTIVYNALLTEYVSVRNRHIRTMMQVLDAYLESVSPVEDLMRASDR